MRKNSECFSYNKMVEQLLCRQSYDEQPTKTSQHATHALIVPKNDRQHINVKYFKNGKQNYLDEKKNQ